MFKIQKQPVAILAFITILNSAEAYRPNFYDSSTRYPQNRQDWQRSDDVQQGQNERYYNVEPNVRAQTGTSDWGASDTLDSSEVKDDFRATERPVTNEQNLRAGTFPQTEQHLHQHFHYRNPSPQGPRFPDAGGQDNRRYDDGLIFKVQRNPEGKLNVVFNDTAFSEPKPQGSIGLTNRGHIPMSPPKRDIVFPRDDIPRPQANQMSPRCHGTGKMFCTEVENYPRDVVARVLNAESIKYEQLFGEDILPDQSPNITQRIDAPGEESLCMSTAKIIYPQAGLTKDNNWSFIVNQPNYTQGVRIEECTNPGKPCSMTDNFPLTYTTECRQKFIYRQLVSINPEGSVAKDLFQLPSCCTCILKTMNRFKRQARSRN